MVNHILNMKNSSLKIYWAFSLLALLNLDCRAQTLIMSTVAGGGNLSIGNSGVPATSAQLQLPSGVAVDATGNVYIADPDMNSILKVNATNGLITIFAGSVNGGGFSGDGGLADTATLAGPVGVGVDGNGNVYIADAGNDRIRKVDVNTGIITTIAGNGIPGLSGDGGPATSAKLNGPSGVAVDVFGNVYIADRQNNRIRKVSAANGHISTIAGKSAANGNGGFSGDGARADFAELAQPNGVAVDASSNVYIADLSNNRIRKITVSTGIITTIAGSGPGVSTGTFSGDGGSADSAGLYYPRGVAVDISGNLYIMDSQNNRVRKVSAGIITTVVGNGTPGYSGDGGPADSAEINGADNGVAVSGFGDVYVADVYNNVIHKASSGLTDISAISLTHDITVYPNPFIDEVTVSGLQQNNNYQLTLSDIQGRQIQQYLLQNQTSVEIHLPDYITSGLHLLRINNGEKTETMKLVKR
ncbi:MAG: hypothetical protein JWO06_2978 [Bacteroidota bacterium]|nr:hypothetical protein [Bacteroidota bacterium]